MSENEAPDNEAIDDVLVDEAEEPATPAPKAEKKSGGGIVAWLALLIALVAAAGVGIDYLRTRNAEGSATAAAAANETRLRELTTSFGATQQALLALEERLATLTSADSEHGNAIDRINRQLNDRLQRLEGVPGRLATVEATMASLQGISTGARDAWLLAEAEYYMQIANAQLQLAGNPELAMLALTHADERVVQLGDPRLTGVRQALSDELRALEIMEKPDTAGISLTLASLADVVDALPLRQEAMTAVDSAADGVDPTLTGMDRAWASVRSALDGVVKVRDANEVEHPFVAPEAQYFLRTNLSLQLQAARLALLRGEDEVFRQSLDDADAWLTAFYAEDSAGVRSARETITEVRDSVFQVAMPDISGSLRLLRQYNALSGAAAADRDADTAAESGLEQ
jgi:uroporphyrin-3 C-methyltransferase